MLNPQTARQAKTGKMMYSIINYYGDGFVELDIDNIHERALKDNKKFDIQKAEEARIAREAALREAYEAELQAILDANQVVDPDVAAKLQDGWNLKMDYENWHGRDSWIELAEKYQVASKSEFVVYRASYKLYDEIASWTLDKKFATDLADEWKHDSDAAYRQLFTKTVHVGDMVTFIGNQNGYEQFEVIC